MNSTQTKLKDVLLHRASVSPFAAVTFGILSATGLLLFFHVKNGPIMVLHEWVGWIFVITGTVHGLLNWRPLVSYLRQRNAVVALILSALLVAGLAIAGARKQPPSHLPRPDDNRMTLPR